LFVVNWVRSKEGISITQCAVSAPDRQHVGGRRRDAELHAV